MIKGETTVAVIGGGAAGIAAARRLHDAGVSYLLVEARARLGGRAWTIEAAGHPVDLGCGWLHSVDRNEWTRIAEAQGRTLDRSRPPWQRAQAARDLTPEERRAFEQAMARFFERVSAAAAEERDIAAGELLEAGGRWNGLINSVVSYISGADAARVSVRDFENYEDTEVNWRVIEGYGAVVAAHAADVSVLLDCPVTRIDHAGKQLRIETSRGPITAEKAIITLPSTILAENEAFFAPALPEKTKAAAGVPLGLADKLYLALDRADEFERDTRLYGRTDRSTGSYTLHAYGLPRIECYYGGGLAAELERGGENAFFDHAVTELCAHFGSAFAQRVRPLALHRWGADPWARGSYSFALPGHAEDRPALAAPVDDRLFFAGEACSKHDFSTAHGAYRTGILAAEQVMATLRARR